MSDAAQQTEHAGYRIARPRRLQWLRWSTWAMLVFLYAPILVLALFSFNNSSSQAVWGGFSGRWYGVALRNTAVIEAIKRSLVVATVATIFSTCIGTLAGLGLSRRFPGRSATIGLLYLPMLVPEIVLAVMLLLLFRSDFWAGGIAWMLDNGFFQSGFWCNAMAWFERTLPTLYARDPTHAGPHTVIFAHVVFSVSYVAIVVRARLAGFDQTLEEAAHDLGANRWSTFWRVKFPLILPGVLGGALLAFTVSVDDYLITTFVNPQGYNTLPIHIYGQVRRGITPEINAVCSMLFVATALAILLTQWLTRMGLQKTND